MESTYFLIRQIKRTFVNDRCCEWVIEVRNPNTGHTSFMYFRTRREHAPHRQKPAPTPDSRCDRRTHERSHPMIADTEARRIASEWHGGGGTALYAFASTGAIDTARADHDIRTEIVACLTDALKNNETMIRDAIDLGALGGYIDRHGKRGPVPGWADLT